MLIGSPFPVTHKSRRGVTHQGKMYDCVACGYVAPKSGARLCQHCGARTVTGLNIDNVSCSECVRKSQAKSRTG